VKNSIEKYGPFYHVAEVQKSVVKVQRAYCNQVLQQYSIVRCPQFWYSR